MENVSRQFHVHAKSDQYCSMCNIKHVGACKRGDPSKGGNVEVYSLFSVTPLGLFRLTNIPAVKHGVIIFVVIRRTFGFRLRVRDVCVSVDVANLGYPSGHSLSALMPIAEVVLLLKSAGWKLSCVDNGCVVAEHD